MPTLAGTPSDDVPAILATGQVDVGCIFVSLSARHPDGHDQRYLEWHSLDHRPEQHRLGALRTSQRLVSTPACRAARMVTGERFGAADHVMSYLFSDRGGLDGFVDLSVGLREAGRTPELLPLVERGIYVPVGRAASPRVKVGADVLPWWPVRGVYLVIEEGPVASPADLTAVPGVGGAWWASGDPEGPLDAGADTGADTVGLQLTYLYLDEDPAETAAALRGPLEERWARQQLSPLLAAPFHVPVPYDWGRYLP